MTADGLVERVGDFVKHLEIPANQFAAAVAVADAATTTERQGHGRSGRRAATEKTDDDGGGGMHPARGRRGEIAEAKWSEDERTREILRPALFGYLPMNQPSHLPPLGQGELPRSGGSFPLGGGASCCTEAVLSTFSCKTPRLTNESGNR